MEAKQSLETQLQKVEQQLFEETQNCLVARQEAAEIRQSMDDLTAAKSEVETELQQEADRNQKYTQELLQVRKDLAELEERYASVKATENHQAEQIESLAAENKDLLLRTDKLNKDLEESALVASQLRTSYNERLEQWNASHRQLSDELNKNRSAVVLEQQLENVLESNHVLERVISKIHSSLEEKKDQNDSLKTELNGLRDMVERLHNDRKVS